MIRRFYVMHVEGRRQSWPIVVRLDDDLVAALRRDGIEVTPFLRPWWQFWHRTR